MSMLPIRQGDIVIPALPKRQYRVGNNTVVQQPFSATKQTVEIFESRLTLGLCRFLRNF